MFIIVIIITQEKYIIWFDLMDQPMADYIISSIFKCNSLNPLKILRIAIQNNLVPDKPFKNSKIKTFNV